jgi:hypothetical protein
MDDATANEPGEQETQKTDDCAMIETRQPRAHRPANLPEL